MYDLFEKNSGGAPTPGPSPLPWTQERRDISMIMGYSISLLDRIVIGGICLQRLWQYHKAGVLSWKELKVRFHVVLFMTVREMACEQCLCARVSFCMGH